MNPLGIITLISSIVSVAYSSEQLPGGGVERRVFGVPVYNSTWEGVKRRQARRAKKRARREAPHKEPGRYLDDKFGGRK